MTKELFRNAFEAGVQYQKQFESKLAEVYYKPDFETWYEQNYGNTVLCKPATDGAVGAAVASSAVGQNGSVGCLHKRWYEFDDCVVCLDCGLKKD
jgi:hypothetical protein